MEKHVKTGSIISRVRVEQDIQITFTHKEAQVLLAITGYGPEKFLEWFERNLGKHYIAANRATVKPLFTKLYNELNMHLHKLDEIEKLITAASSK